MQCLHDWIQRTPVLGMAGLWRPWGGQTGGRIRNGIENRNSGIVAPTLFVQKESQSRQEETEGFRRGRMLKKSPYLAAYTVQFLAEEGVIEE